MDGKIIYKDYVTQTNSDGYVGNSSWLVNKVIKFSILSPKRYACEEFINEIGEPYYYIYVYGRGENPIPLVSQDVTVRVFFAENTKNI